jgi:hypothetical protein
VPFSASFEDHPVIERAMRVRQNPIAAYSTAVAAVAVATLRAGLLDGRRHVCWAGEQQPVSTPVIAADARRSAKVIRFKNDRAGPECLLPLRPDDVVVRADQAV